MRRNPEERLPDDISRRQKRKRFPKRILKLNLGERSSNFKKRLLMQKELRIGKAGRISDFLCLGDSGRGLLWVNH